jgi:hypothetical protein
MPDFDKVTISSGGKEVVSLEADVSKAPPPLKFKLSGGKVSCWNTNGVPVLVMYGNDNFGGIEITDSEHQIRVSLRGGASGGHISLSSLKPGMPTIELDADEGSLVVRNPDGTDLVTIGHGRNLSVGAEGQHGGIRLDGENSAISLSTFNPVANKQEEWIRLDAGEEGSTHGIRLRGVDPRQEQPFPGPPVDVIRLENQTGTMWLGGHGNAGHLAIFSENGDNETFPQATIHLDGQAGDIFLQNADCAEEFDVTESNAIEPGTVMVIDQEGALRPSTEAYDKRVAGVISGAGDCKPGITLAKRPSQSNRMPVALIGKVYCKVDSLYSPIEAGDLLTTSPTLGHAMKATDPLKAVGAVIGKTLRPFNAGCGLVPVLIALQ